MLAADSGYVCFKGHIYKKKKKKGKGKAAADVQKNILASNKYKNERSDTIPKAMLFRDIGLHFVAFLLKMLCIIV